MIDLNHRLMLLFHNLICLSLRQKGGNSKAYIQMPYFTNHDTPDRQYDPDLPP